MSDRDYETTRQKYRPEAIKWLFVAESPPPPEEKISTRYFYKTDVGEGDRLFVNTMRALYPETKLASEAGIEAKKEEWLQRFKADGCYMVESLTESLPHGTKTSERKKHLKENLPNLIERLKLLVGSETKVLLIKSTVFDTSAEPLRQAGFNVINETFLDYPGFWREKQYQEKLTALMKKHNW